MRAKAEAIAQPPKIVEKVVERLVTVPVKRASLKSPKSQHPKIGATDRQRVINERFVGQYVGEDVWPFVSGGAGATPSETSIRQDGASFAITPVPILVQAKRQAYSGLQSLDELSVKSADHRVLVVRARQVERFPGESQFLGHHPRFVLNIIEGNISAGMGHDALEPSNTVSKKDLKRRQISICRICGDPTV